jgi:hypothetical protein
MPINSLAPDSQNALGAAFGYFPHLRRNRTVQDPQAALDMPVQFLRGRAAATAGIPSDLMNLLRTPMPMEAFGDVSYDQQPQVPYGTQDLLQRLPLAPQGPAQQAASNLGSAVPITPMEALQAARLARQAAFATKGMPVGMSTEAVGGMNFLNPAEYRAGHTAPGPDFGAPLHDLTGGGQMYPADVYSAKAAQYYGTGFPIADKEAFALAHRVRGNPNAEVLMYRAVPKDEKISGINPGDWVTLSKDYAKTHGESALKGDYKILSQKVKAKDLWTNADSIHEFGYHPQMSGVVGPQDEALRLAQQRAALPVEQGGLGLPANNTADQRAVAMGFNTPAFHATDAVDIANFDITKLGENTARNTDSKWAERLAKSGVWTSEKDLSKQMNSDVSYPLLITNPQYSSKSLDNLERKIKKQGKLLGTTKVSDEEFGGLSFVVPNPDNIRSRFAAFDPWRRNAAIAAAMGVAAPDLLAEEKPRNQLRSNR